MSSPKAAVKVQRRRSATAAKLKAVATRTVAPKPKTPQTGLSADAIKLAGEIEQAFKKSDDAISEDAMQTLMGDVVPGLCGAGRERRQVHADRGRTDRQPDRRHGDGERAVARRQSRGVRTRNVAELDGALSDRSANRISEFQEKTSWTLLQIAADASQSKN